VTSDALVGIAASPGLAAGLAVRHDGVAGLTVEPAESVAAASARVVADLQARAARASSTEGRSVLEALVQFAADPELVGGAQTMVDSGVDASEAVRTVATRFADKLQSLGGYFAERAPDILDIGERMVAALEGRATADLPNPGYPYVLVARDLAPADTATLDASVVVAIVTEQGGPTSHTAILARGLGIPAVVGVRGARDAADGEQVVVDGDLGEVHVAPDPTITQALRARDERRRSRSKVVSGPGRTSDGISVKLLVNVGTLADARVAAESDAEGIGLFRSEFLFLGRRDEPSVDEQVEAYSQVLGRFVGRRVVVRTLDAGSDKPLPFLGLDDEENPALGVRGLRTAVSRPEVLERQLVALASAAARTGAEPWVMAPMVSTVNEARWFAAQARAIGLPAVGIMVEVPAAALRSRHLLAEVDFASLGTNDLAQYALAADRQQGELGSLLDPWQPAVLDLVERACEGATHNDRPIGVCGEAAADPALAAVLVGLGVRSLSMAPVALPEVRALLRDVDLTTCERAAAAALAAPTAADARSAAWAALET
jgi:phosphotransferase system enzyme I (PtsI)